MGFLVVFQIPAPKGAPLEPQTGVSCVLCVEAQPETAGKTSLAETGETTLTDSFRTESDLVR